MLLPTHEQEILNSTNYKTVVGIDEAGRGAWAGPVAIGYYAYQIESATYKGVNDSKKVKQDLRTSLFNEVSNSNSVFGILMPTSQNIDSYGIGVTIQNAITHIVSLFDSESTYFIIDGQFSVDFGLNTVKKIKADQNYYCVAAASILAKVTRDDFMSKLDSEYPNFNFAKHKGYGTALHANEIKQFGLTNIHRTSYKIQ